MQINHLMNEKDNRFFFPRLLNSNRTSVENTKLYAVKSSESNRHKSDDKLRELPKNSTLVRILGLEVFTVEPAKPSVHGDNMSLNHK